MADFTATEAERAAASYLDWDDEALGKFTKHVATLFVQNQEDADGLHKVNSASCLMILVGMCIDANASRLTSTLEGFEHKGASFGSWRITLERLPDA